MTQPNPLKMKILDPLPTQPNPTQPVGQPNPWTTLKHNTTLCFMWRSIFSTSGLLVGDMVNRCKFPKNRIN